MRVIVCGSRNWGNRDRIMNRLADLTPYTVLRPGIVMLTTVVTGGARGVDRIAHQEAQKLGLLTEVHMADWEKHKKQAGFIRNEYMAQLGADLCIAFWDGQSNGTRDMMQRAEEFGIPVEIVWKETYAKT